MDITTLKLSLGGCWVDFGQAAIYYYAVVLFGELGYVVYGVVLDIDFYGADDAFAADDDVLFEAEYFVDLLC